MIQHIENKKDQCPTCERVTKIGLFRSEDGSYFIVCRDCMQALTDKITKTKKQPIVFNKSTKEWEGLVGTEMEEWMEEYEGVAVVDELLKMRDWIIKCEDKKRTNKRDWRRFILNWLRRASNAKR